MDHRPVGDGHGRNLTPVKPWIVRWGRTSWLLVGIAVLVAVVSTLSSILSGIVVPFVVAVVIGTLSAPVVQWCSAHRLPRWAGALIVIVALALIVVGALLITIHGIVDESDEIAAVVRNGLDEINNWLAQHGIDSTNTSDQMDQIGDMAGPVLGGLASQLASIFSGLVSFGFGIFLATFMLYYVLTDFDGLRDWAGRHLGVPADLGADIVEDSVHVLRRGYLALTLSSLCTAVLIGLAMVALGLPLAFTVAIVTFVTSYIPYIGAIFAGAFGFLVALGSGGLGDAIVLLIVILVVQNVVQTVVGNRLMSMSLALHPLASLIATIVGGIVAGFLGAILGAPFLAVVLQVSKRVREYQQQHPVAATAGP